MPAALLAIVTEPLSVEALCARVQSAAEAIDEGCGALCSFVGVVRATHQGRACRYLEYEAFEPLAMKTFQQIARKPPPSGPGACSESCTARAVSTVGEASVVIVAAAAHRAESFAVCRYAIERVKQIAPVWKHEFFDDGAGVGRRCGRRSGGSGGAPARARSGHARDRAALRAVARTGRPRRDGRATLPPGASVADVWRALEVDASRACPVRRIGLGAPSTPSSPR